MDTEIFNFATGPSSKKGVVITDKQDYIILNKEACNEVLRLQKMVLVYYYHFKNNLEIPPSKDAILEEMVNYPSEFADKDKLQKILETFDDTFCKNGRTIGRNNVDYPKFYSPFIYYIDSINTNRNCFGCTPQLLYKQIIGLYDLEDADFNTLYEIVIKASTPDSAGGKRSRARKTYRRQKSFKPKGRRSFKKQKEGKKATSRKNKKASK